jgi:hypothetical protein
MTAMTAATGAIVLMKTGNVAFRPRVMVMHGAIPLGRAFSRTARFVRLARLGRFDEIRARLFLMLARLRMQFVRVLALALVMGMGLELVSFTVGFALGSRGCDRQHLARFLTGTRG